jgi:uncharacterized protein (DUF736 family)
MAQIGSFTKDATGSYNGTIQTLTLNVRATIRPVEKMSDKAPDFRVHSGRAELGAGWLKLSQEGNTYISLKLDDPSFPAAIFASLVEGEGEEEYQLLWSRSNGR